MEGQSSRQMCGGSQQAIEKMLQFGRELQAMSQRLRHQFGHSDTNKKAIQVGLLAVCVCVCVCLLVCVLSRVYFYGYQCLFMNTE